MFQRYTNVRAETWQSSWSLRVFRWNNPVGSRQESDLKCLVKNVIPVNLRDSLQTYGSRFLVDLHVEPATNKEEPS